MKCDIIQDLLPTYLDGTCSEETKKVIEEHLNKCEECTKIIQDFKELDTLSHPTIDEKKPFKKIKRSHINKIVILCTIFVFIFLLFDTRLNSEIMKLRFKHYVNNHYPNEHLVLTDFEYNDPESQGFGINNGFYSATFKSKEENKEDMKFNVFTDGFIFSIKDTYQNSINNRSNTNSRLLKDYENDVKKTLLKQKDFYLINVFASTACTEDYFIQNIAEKLDLNMPYTKNIDQTIPIDLLLELNANEDDLLNIHSYISKIINQLHQANFNPSRMTLIIETQKDTYRISDIDCTKEIENQDINFD